jgi:hypothetical protein
VLVRPRVPKARPLAFDLAGRAHAALVRSRRRRGVPEGSESEPERRDRAGSFCSSPSTRPARPALPSSRRNKPSSVVPQTSCHGRFSLCRVPGR